MIHELHRQLVLQQEDARQNAEQVEELKEYASIQASCFTTQLAGRDQIIEEVNTKIIQQQNDWNAEKEKLENKCAEMQTVSEKRRVDLYVAEAKLMQAEGATNVVITDLR